MTHATRILAIAALLTSAALACNLPFAGRAEPEPTPTVSVADAESFVEAWKQAIQISEETGVLSLTLTEAQMTAFLGVALAERPDLPISNPSVELRDGEMEIRGTYTADAISANFTIVMEVTVNESGTPVIEATSGTVGPLPVPSELLAGISEVVNQALTGQVAPTATGFKLTQISITEGEISLTGSLQ